MAYNALPRKFPVAPAPGFRSTPPTRWSGRRLGFEFDLVSQRVEPLDQTQGHAFLGQTVEVGLAQILEALRSGSASGTPQSGSCGRSPSARASRPGAI